MKAHPLPLQEPLLQQRACLLSLNFLRVPYHGINHTLRSFSYLLVGGHDRHSLVWARILFRCKWCVWECHITEIFDGNWMDVCGCVGMLRGFVKASMRVDTLAMLMWRWSQPKREHKSGRVFTAASCKLPTRARSSWLSFSDTTSSGTDLLSRERLMAEISFTYWVWFTSLL